MKQRLLHILFTFAGAWCWLQAGAADTVVYVAPDSPEALSQALRQTREYRRLHGGGTAQLRLGKGIYRLYEPLRLRPEDSGLSIVGVDGAEVVGSMPITGWQRKGKLWVAAVPRFNGRPVEFRQLWVNGRKAVRARSVSDFEQMPRIKSYDKVRRELWVPTRAVKGITVTEGQTELVLHQMWEIGILRIKAMRQQGDSTAISFCDPESRLQFEHPWPSPMTDGLHNSPFYLTNAPELLDEPGEWYLDTDTRQLYYMPLPGEDMRQATVEAPVLETVVEVVGSTVGKPRNISFSNISFGYTSWLRPSLQGHVPLQVGMYLTEAYKLRPKADRPNNHKLDNQGWLGRAAAAVQVSWADSISFDGCTFAHLGGSGVDYVVGCQGGSVDRCTFTDIALNGYVAGSFSPEGLETHLPYRPAEAEVCQGQRVAHSLFTDIGDEDWGCVAIAAGYVRGIDISHNEIHRVPYSGISLGWGWNRDSVCMANNRVHANLVYDYARRMYDCAGIYTLGNQPGTVISENVVRDIASPSYVHDPEHWFYLYTDEGSSNITLRDNWTPTDKYLKNAVGPGNVWENNGPQVSNDIKARAGR
jgi:hypothetical protein